MRQTNPRNQTPSLDLLVLFYENEFNPPINPTLLLKKSLAFFFKLFQNTPIIKHSKLDYNVFHLICFQLYVWKCMIPLPSPNIFKHNLMIFIFLILNFSHTHNYTQKWHFIWIPSKPNTISHDQGFSRKAFLNIDPMDVTIHSPTLVCTRSTFDYWVMFGGWACLP